jgi:hypothetical protein
VPTRSRGLRRAAVRCFAACLASSGVASADVSSFIFVGGGASVVHSEETKAFGALSVDAGLATPASADNWLVWGGVFHGTGHFGYGLDLGGALRIATSSYARGLWGLGLDVGPEYHFGTDAGVRGAGRLLLGAPWGVSASLGGHLGPDGVSAGIFTVGIDFARLTVHRESGLSWLPNPSLGPLRHP